MTRTFAVRAIGVRSVQGTTCTSWPGAYGTGLCALVAVLPSLSCEVSKEASQWIGMPVASVEGTPGQAGRRIARGSDRYAGRSLRWPDDAWCLPGRGSQEGFRKGTSIVYVGFHGSCLPRSAIGCLLGKVVVDAPRPGQV